MYIPRGIVDCTVSAADQGGGRRRRGAKGHENQRKGFIP